MKLDMLILALASFILLISIVTSLAGDLYFGGVVKKIGDLSCFAAIILFVLAFIVSFLDKKKGNGDTIVADGEPLTKKHPISKPK